MSQLVREDLSSCKTKYEESILLLEAVLIIPTHQHVNKKDVIIIENCKRDSLHKIAEKNLISHF